VGGILDLGVETGLIEKRGSFYSYKEDRLGQGRENTKDFLREHPEMVEELDHRIRVHAGLLDGEDVDQAPDQEQSDQIVTAADSDELEKSKTKSKVSAKNGRSQKELA